MKKIIIPILLGFAFLAVSCEKYLEIAPNAGNAGQIAYTVGALYQTAKNNAKAKEYYQKAVNDPRFGEEAKKMLNALK